MVVVLEVFSEKFTFLNTLIIGVTYFIFMTQIAFEYVDFIQLVTDKGLKDSVP